MQYYQRPIGFPTSYKIAQTELNHSLIRLTRVKAFLANPTAAVTTQLPRVREIYIYIAPLQCSDKGINKSINNIFEDIRFL